MSHTVFDGFQKDSYFVQIEKDRVSFDGWEDDIYDSMKNGGVLQSSNSITVK